MRCHTPPPGLSPTGVPTASATRRSLRCSMPSTGASMVKRFDAREMGSEEVVAHLRRPGGFLAPEIRDSARRIVEDVRGRGDAALIEYTRRFDGVRLAQIRVPDKAIERSRASLPTELEASFLTAFENVRAFHKREMDSSWETSRNGATVGQRVRSLRRAGVYVPGGHGAYPSTLMMAAIPAQVAGVGEICVCAPPGPDGRVSGWVLAVAGLLGLGEVYAVGGAQAVGAMAFGTETVPAVDKIVGPGNDYVTAAKLEVFGTVGVDAPQGPSELVVIADAGAFPERVARDLMAQAEHLSGASAILISPSAGLLKDVMPLLTGEPARLVSLVHASPVALADYGAGPSHALPTGGTAKWASALGTHDFTVRTNYVHYTGGALASYGPHVERLARLEGFENHAESVAVRLDNGKGDDGP